MYNKKHYSSEILIRSMFVTYGITSGGCTFFFILITLFKMIAPIGNGEKESSKCFESA